MYVAVSLSSLVAALADIGYSDNPDTIQGVGLPNFMQSHPPPQGNTTSQGQPLLRNNDQTRVYSFLDHFGTTGEEVSEGVMQTSYAWDGVAPTYLAASTELGQHGPNIDHDQRQLNDMPFNDPYMSGDIFAPNSHTFDPALPTTTTAEYQHHSYPNPVHYQYPTSNSYIGQTHWQTYNGHQIQSAHPNGRPVVRFGSDSHFHASGYAPPADQQNPEELALGPMDFLERDSATNTAPNTQPNTQPSSPNWTRKRKIEELHEEGVQTLSQLFPPHTNGFHNTINDQHADAAFEEDDDDEASQLAAAQPSSSKRRKQSTSNNTNHSIKTPPSTAKRPPRARQKSTSSQFSRPQLKTSNSTTSNGDTTPAKTGRQPLSTEQKKANHTSSEQRRRDATGRAYSELYDLVPELADLGKMSTTKKLEKVVEKMRNVQSGNAELIELLER